LPDHWETSPNQSTYGKIKFASLSDVKMGVTAMNSKEKAQQSARLLVDAFSNSTHIWNDNVETSPKAQDEEINRETFLKLPKAPQLIMPQR
jgi:hypothetical protein